MSERPEWFIEQRTRAMALMHLTRRDDLAIAEPDRDGQTLYVTLARGKGQPSFRTFAVFLRGDRAAASKEELERSLRPSFRSMLRSGEYPYPVCVWHFGMAGDQAHHCWLAEPDVADGAPRLIMHDAPHCLPLDRAALDEIVSRVDAWYDAFFDRVAVRAS